MMSKQLSSFEGLKEELFPLLSVVFDYLSANIIDSNARSPAMAVLGLIWEKQSGFSGIIYTIALLSSLIGKRIYRSSLSWRGDEVHFFRSKSTIMHLYLFTLNLFCSLLGNNGLAKL